MVKRTCFYSRSRTFVFDFFLENGEEENCLELWNRDGKGLKWNDSPCSYGL